MARLDRLPGSRRWRRSAPASAASSHYTLLAAVVVRAGGRARRRRSTSCRRRADLPPRHPARRHLQLQARAGPGRGLREPAQSPTPSAARPHCRALESDSVRREIALDVIAEHFSRAPVAQGHGILSAGRREARGRRHAIKEALALYDQALALGGHLDARETADILMAIHQARSELYFAIGSFDQSRPKTPMLDIPARVSATAIARASRSRGWRGPRCGRGLSLGARACARGDRVAEAVGCQSALGNAQMITGFVHAVSGRLIPPCEALGKTLTVCRPAGDVLGANRCALHVLPHRELARAIRPGDRAASTEAALAREHNLISAFLRNLYAQGLAPTGEGNYDLAAALLTEGLALAEKIRR